MTLSLKSNDIDQLVNKYSFTTATKHMLQLKNCPRFLKEKKQPKPNTQINPQVSEREKNKPNPHTDKFTGYWKKNITDKQRLLSFSQASMVVQTFFTSQEAEESVCGQTEKWCREVLQSSDLVLRMLCKSKGSLWFLSFSRCLWYWSTFLIRVRFWELSFSYSSAVRELLYLSVISPPLIVNGEEAGSCRVQSISPLLDICLSTRRLIH